MYHITRNPYKRVAWSMILGLIYYYNVPKWIYDTQKNFRARQLKSYKARWHKYYKVESIRHTETIESFSQPQIASKILKNKNDGKAKVAFTSSQIDALANLMLEMEESLRYGFSRELVTRTLKNTRMIEQFGHNPKLSDNSKIKPAE